jgi:hypothetical protein
MEAFDLVKKLNDKARVYYFTVENRSYIHSSNILCCISSCIDEDVPISLTSLKPITNGFVFSMTKSENDLAILSFENLTLYVKENISDAILNKMSIDLDCEHRTIMRYQNIIGELLSLSSYETQQYMWWSYRVTWFPKTILKPKIDKFQFEIVKNKRKVKEIHVYYDDQLAWSQEVIKK